MTKYPRLFEPIKLRGLTLPNRIVMPGMGSLMMHDTYVNDTLIDYHVARAKGGTALNVVEVSNVYAPAAPPRYGALTDDKYIPGYKRLTDAIHAAGGRASIFLWHPGLVAGSFPGLELVVPSDMDFMGQQLKGASTDLLGHIVHCYGQAARRAVEAGMDALELHGAHNYLLHSFMSPAINHRTDTYGGSTENRARLALETIAEIRRNMPEDMPLFMRINACDDYLPGGLTVEEMTEMCKLFGQAGVDVIDVSRGNTMTAALKYEVPSLDIPFAFNADNAAAIRAGTGMTVMAVGRINGAMLAEGLLEAGKCDLVAIGRAQITDPEFVNKAREGRESEILRCMGCNQGCFDAHMGNGLPHITCVRNPAVGHEQEYALQQTDSPKRVLVAGGGLAGMEAACTLAQRGHQVTLCEGMGTLGGRFLTAGLAPRKGEMRAAATHKATLTRRAGVDVRLNTPATVALLEALSPEVVINAVGAHAAPPVIPGCDGEHVFLAADVLEGAALPPGPVAVVGGGMVGVETADFLGQQGREVTVIEMTAEIAADLGAIRKICTLESLAQLPVTLMTEAKATAITGAGVAVRREGEEALIPAAAVVLAAGARSNDFSDQAAWCGQHGVPIYTVGDGASPRKALEAIAEAAEIAREI